ncbi:hypothetical protein C8R46DRAFT_1346442 [Mycena filopes]|nr:hypothetical protein C8R46DRAFT_1346442 [Mycena filopes]
MASKRKEPDTIMDSGSSSSSSTTSDHNASNSDNDTEFVYCETISRDILGRRVYNASVMTFSIPLPPTALAAPPLATEAHRNGTWIYDFMDNDWTFGEDVRPQDDINEPPGSAASSDSESEDEAPTAREPYRPVKTWKERYRSRWLEELLRGEGRGDHIAHPRCVCGHPACASEVGEVRCKDCYGGELLGIQCAVRDHARSPLHRVERWNPEHGCFDAVSLRALGLKFYLGRELHPSRVCPHTKKAPGKAFIVIDDNGLHDVALHYCNCGKGASFPIQLLRMKWLPSTGKHPKTAATFNVMRRYHALSLESKCSMSEFYNSLVRLTNNTGEPPPSRYQEFINLTREWRNLEILKRGACGHDTSGIDGAKPGSCALECPACPHPGKNIPPDWKSVAPEKKFLYALFLALDANFRMQRKDVSSEASDPSLGNGLAFYGEVNAYMAHLEKNWDQPQPKSTCVAHDAVNTPDKEARGTASSGIATVDCARHNMKRPRGIGDLQQGERYLNVDWMFFMSLEECDLQHFFVSYDIACQWHKNIWDRLQIYPRHIQKQNGQRWFVFLVPKFHLPAHIESCNINFSFLLTRYVGQTDGESPERGWSSINRLATSTREMGPNLRREVLDAHFNDWNWKKILGMGKYLLEKITHYIPDMVSTRQDTLDQERTLPRATLAKWRTGCEAWEADAAAANPFQRTRDQVTIASVRYELAQEGKAIVRGQTDSSDMLAMGVQLEEQQRQLRFDQASAGDHPTVDQKRVMLERCSKARRKILTWMDTQALFMPEVTVLRLAAAEKRAEESRTKPVAGELVQDMPLLLPSGLAADVVCLRQLQEFEFRLREGQAHQALYEIRHQLLVRTHEYKYKDKNIRGVRDNMRSNTKIKGIDAQINRATATYQTARKALDVLGERLGRYDWEKVLQVLHAGDVRQMPEGTFRKERAGKRNRESAGAKKRRRKSERQPVSWIWLADGSAVDADRNPAMNEALRIEWAKTRALGLRNTEEVDLLEEEMRRVPAFLRWRADWWDSKKIHDSDTRPDLLADSRQREGHDAYATRQALMLRRLAASFEKKWAHVPTLISAARADVAAAEAAAAAAAVEEAAVEARRAKGARAREGGAGGGGEGGDDDEENGGDNEDQDDGGGDSEDEGSEDGDDEGSEDGDDEGSEDGDDADNGDGDDADNGDDGYMV